MNTKDTNKYLYIDKTPTWLIRTVYIFGIFTWVGVLYGYSLFLQSDPIFLFIITPIIIFLALYHLVSYFITLFYTQFDLKQHRIFLNNYELENHSKPLPLIDIFLPVCGEDVEVLRRTFTAVTKLKHLRKKIYVLDDKGVPEHKLLAESFKFTYLSRENKGFMKKAGNIKHGFDLSQGDFFVIFDADFAPDQDFIKELLPYMEDPSLAIIQTPQYFQTDKEVHKRSILEYGASHIQEDFYRTIQVARSNLGAPICCGSNAMYRRSALKDVGGTFQIEHSEDMYTGLALISMGWKVKYIPIILATGFCPDDLQSFFHQQHRWCSGSISLMLDKRFWKSKISFAQKMCFISGFMYYLSHPITILFSFQVFFLLFLFKDSVSLSNAIPFVPCILFSFIVVPLSRITKQRYGGFLARNICVYSYTHAVITALIKRSIGWEPTNVKNAQISKAYTQQLVFVALYLLIYIISISISIKYGVFQLDNVNYYAVLFWVFYTLIVTSTVLAHLYLLVDQTMQKQKKEKAITQPFFWRLKTFGTYTAITAGLFLGVINTPTINNKDSTIASINITPLAMGETLSLLQSEILFPKTYFFTKNHFLGDKDEDIIWLQKYLNEAGFLVQEKGTGSFGNETEYFGKYTYNALKQFQEVNNLPITGILDSETRNVINGISG